MKRIFEFLGSSMMLVLMFSALPGWAYWMWMSIMLGSFGMFCFGLLGPFAFVASMLGLWSLLLGVPSWLLSLAS